MAALSESHRVPQGGRAYLWGPHGAPMGAAALQGGPLGPFTLVATFDVRAMQEAMEQRTELEQQFEMVSADMYVSSDIARITNERKLP